MVLLQKTWLPAVDLAWRTAFRIGFPLARLWWRLRRPPHEGALVAVHVGRDLLLLRCSYRRQWNFPGGGVRPGEAPEAAARRELREEIGLSAPTLLPAGTTAGVYDCRPDRVHFFELRLDRLPELSLDNREIVAAKLFAPEELRGIGLTRPVLDYLAARSSAAQGA